MTKPNIQIDNQVREMTDEEYEILLTSGWLTNIDYEEQLLVKMRNQRNELLKQSDWTQLEDAPVNKQAWAAYRQQLRDFPTTWIPSDKVQFPDTP